METINSNTQFNWGSYYAEGKSSFKKELEEKPQMLDSWTGNDSKHNEYNRYRLVTKLIIVENNVDDHPNGTVTGHLKCFIEAASIKELTQLWNSKFIQSRYDSTYQHFIVDMLDRKIITFLSVCM